MGKRKSLGLDREIRKWLGGDFETHTGYCRVSEQLTA